MEVTMDLTAMFFAVAVPAAILAGISKGGFAGGGAFVSTTMMAVVVEPVFAIAVMLPILLLIDITTLKIYWRQWVPRLSIALIFGGVIGVLLGAVVFHDADPDVIRVFIGAISIGFVAFQGAKELGLLPTQPLSYRFLPAAVSGAGAGFTSFVAHAGSPPFAIYVLRLGLSKLDYQATSVVVFWWINLAKLPLYQSLGMFPDTFWWAFLVLAPAAFLGTLLGAWLHKRVSNAAFTGVIHFFLLLGGAKLLFDGLT